MRPFLALICLLQTEQERFEEGSSVGDALALAFRCARFCSASLIGLGVTSYQWHSANVRVEWPPLLALPGIRLAPFFQQKNIRLTRFFLICI